MYFTDVQKQRTQSDIESTDSRSNTEIDQLTLRFFTSVNDITSALNHVVIIIIIQLITNSDLSDIQWTQASLPDKDDGLGVRRVSSLALPAFLASAASTLSLQVDILAECPNFNNDFLQNSLSDWLIKFGNVPDILPGKQPFWDGPS